MSTAHDLSTSFACLAPGSAIGRYRILRRIAVGGMAEIYLATASGIEGFEKRVAIKRILPQFASIPEYVGMFLDEARLAGRLHHPNIAQVYDIGSDGDSYYFAMEFVDGRDVRHLRKALRARNTTMPLEHALAITMGVAAGLHAAHETRGPDGKNLRVVHRDVSPANILVGFDGSVKLVDFGIARSERRQTQTRVGVLKGKTCHMSPEQCLGEPLDRRSDVFSLGILLYELTTDGRLFGGETEYETMRLIVDGRVPPPALKRAGYPTALEDIVMRALERAPEDRYQSTGEMFVALERFARVQGLRVDPFSLATWVAELTPESEDAVADGNDVPPLFLVPDREVPEIQIHEVEITGEFEDSSFDRMATVDLGSMVPRPRGQLRAASPDSNPDRKATVSLKETSAPRTDPLAVLAAAVPIVDEPERHDSHADTHDLMDPPTALIGATAARPRAPARGLRAFLSVVVAAAAGAAAVWLAVRLLGHPGSTGGASAEAAPAAALDQPAPAPTPSPSLSPAPAPAPVPAPSLTATTPEPTVAAPVTPTAPKLLKRKARRSPPPARKPAPASTTPTPSTSDPSTPAPATPAPATPDAAPAAPPPALLDVPVSSPDA